MSVRNLLMVSLLSVVHVATAQLTITKFIQSASEAPQVRALETQADYLSLKPYQLSPLQKLEFRTKNRELQSDQQEFALRLTPSNPWEVKYNNQYFRNYRTSLQLEKGLALKDALLTRYYAVIELAHLSELRSLSQLSLASVQQQLNVMHQLSGSGQFDGEELVKLEMAQLNGMVEVETIEYEIFSQQGEISKLLSTDTEANWSYQDVLSPARMTVVLDSLHQLQTLAARIAYQRNRVDLYKAEYRLEKSNVNLGFLQTSYDHRRVVQDRTPFNWSLGITIPIVNPNKGDMAKKKLDQLEAEEFLIGLEAETNQEVSNRWRQVQLALKRYNILHEKIEQMAKSPMVANLTTLNNNDPFVALKFNDSVLRMKTLEAKMRRLLLLAFINYLAASDHLQQTPVVDFLSLR